VGALAYRSSSPYRVGAKYQPGVFPLPYRINRAYRSKTEYRTGVDDPIGDTLTVAITETLTVAVTAVQSVGFTESEPSTIGVVPPWDSQQFVEGTSGQLGLAGTETAAAVEAAQQGTHVQSSDEAHVWYGSAQSYRADLDYRSARSYRGAGDFLNVSFPIQADVGSATDTTTSWTVVLTASEAVAAIEAAGIRLENADVAAGLEALGLDVGVTDTVVVADTDVASDRFTVAPGEEFEVTYEVIGPYGEVAQHLSHIAVNRYRSMPSHVRRR